jgi:predicted NBD/HSP70 family sugar kinase
LFGIRHNYMSRGLTQWARPSHEGSEAPTNAETRARSKEAVRRFNLSATLAVIHEHGPVSRAQLIKALGLGRTTVFELLGQLTELGLVEDGAPVDQVGAGRPSLYVKASGSIGAFAVNPELDVLTVGIATLDGQLTTSRTQWTPLGAAETARLAARMLADLRTGRMSTVRIAGVGAGIPGQVAQGSRRVLAAPSLGWNQVDFAAMLADELGMAAQVENNARLVATTEHRLGLARGYRDFVYLFAGAGGIGGGIVSDGRILTGKAGFAGEIGHMRITDPVHDDGRGTVESLIRRDELVASLGRTELDDAELDDLVATANDRTFVITAQRQLRSIGVTLGNLANVLDPHLLLLGGFLGSLYRRFPAVLDEAFRSVALPAVIESLEIRATTHTSENVLRGAAELVFTVLVADPLAVPAALP